MNRESKRNKLEAVELECLKQFSERENKDKSISASYMASLTAKIIDNLEFQITNIHIRYEDTLLTSISDSGLIHNNPNEVAFACGLTINSITLNTTDSNWNEKFVTSNSKIEKIIHKLGKIEHIAVYWTPKAKSFKPFSHMTNQWEAAMRNCISGNSDVSNSNELLYLLSTPNYLSAKIIHRDVSSETSPKLDLFIESNEFKTVCEKKQYQQIMEYMSITYLLEGRKHMAVFRPVERPTKDPRGWWHYAYRLLTGHESNVSKFDSIYRCVRSRRPYIQLVKKCRAFKESQAQKSVGAVFTEADEKELTHYEDILPYATLTIFRQYAAIQYFEEKKSERKADLNKEDNISKKVSSWFSFGTKKVNTAKAAPTTSSPGVNRIDDDDDNEEEDEDIIAKITDIFSQSDENELFNMRVNLQTGLMFTLTSDVTQILNIGMSVKATGEKRQNRTSGMLAVDNLVIVDLCSPNPIRKHLITQSTNNVNSISNNSQSFFELHAEVVGETSTYVMQARSLEVFWNSVCIKEALTIITTVDSSSLFQNPMVKKSMRAFASEASIYITQNIKVSMEMDAPKIIIPESYDSNKGCLVLDMGHFSLSGHKSVADMNINMSLSSINVNMPLQVATIYSKDTSQYLVKPFDFNISVANAPTGITDLIISLGVLPGLRMESDISKISRLLQIANIVSVSFPTKARKVEDIGDEVVPLYDEQEYDDLQPIASSTLKSTSNIDPYRKTFELKFLNPIIKLDIFFTEYYYITMEMKNLQAQITQRPYDDEYKFTMEAMNISDSMRFEKYRAILWSTVNSYTAITDTDIKQANENSNNITISFINAKSKKSPFYVKHAKEVNIIFSQLSLSIDVDSINRLLPYAETMSSLLSRNGAQKSPVYEEESNALSITDSENIAQAAQSVGSLNFKMTVDRVALELMKITTTKSISRKGPPPNPFATPLKVPLPKEIEVAFSSVMSGFSFTLELESEQISSQIILSDFAVYDQRSEFSTYHYKEMICRSKIASEYSNTDKKNNAPAIKNEDENNLLMITFTQDGNPHPSSIIVDILLRDATALVTFGRTLELMKIANEIVNAGLNLSSKFAGKSTASPPSKKVSSRRKSDATTKAVKGRRRSTLSSTINEDINAYTMNVTVKISNPRILILENRSAENSKAIVLRSNIVINYCQDVKNKLTKESRESIHLSVLHAEIFSLYGGVKSGIPLQIVEPSALDFHLNRRCEGGLVLSVSVNFDADDLIAKVSLRDLLLVKAVWTRANLTDFGKVTSGTFSSENSSEEKTDIYSEDGNTRNITMYDIQFHTNTVKIVLINDLFNDNNPILQAHIDSVNASGGGALAMGEYEIEGNILLHTDFYNTRTTTWEPIIEKCQPIFLMSSTTSTGGLIEFKYDSTIQFNLSGAMSSALSHTYSLLNEEIVDSDSEFFAQRERNERHAALRFKNDLGVPINLYDSIRGVHVLTLADSTPTACPPIPMSASETRSSRKNVYPSMFDLRFMGKLDTERAPLLQLPVNVSNPKAYYVRYIGKTGDGATLLEPIVEEVYENQRYDVMKMKWQKPWDKVGEAQWSNAAGDSVDPPDKIALPSERWEWLENTWRVDMTGVIGEDCDENGWEYAISVKAFNMSRKRRTFKPMDCARRRKLIRSRIPKQSEEDMERRPFLVYWDVRVDKFGHRMIVLRSGLQIVNETINPIAINIKFLKTVATPSSSSRTASSTPQKQASSQSSSKLEEIGVVTPNNTWNVPLMSAYANAFKIRPIHKNVYTCSTDIDCRAHNAIIGQWKSTCTDVVCSSQSSPSLFMKSSFTQIDKTVIVTVSSQIILENCVPCDLTYRVTSLASSASLALTSSNPPSPFHQAFTIQPPSSPATLAPLAMEEGCITPGSKVKLLHINLSTRSVVEVKLGELEWSTRVDINEIENDTKHVIDFIESNGKINLSLVIRKVINDHGCTELTFYSSFLYIDRTNLKSVVRSKRKKKITGKTSQSSNKGGEYRDFDSSGKLTTSMFSSVVVERRAHSSILPVSNDTDSNDNFSWVSGNHGMTLFHTDENKVSIGLMSGKIWSDEISLENAENSYIPINIIDKTNNVSFQVAYSLKRLPAIFSASQVLSIVPTFLLINCTSDIICCQQVKEGKGIGVNAGVTKVASQATEEWHRRDANDDNTEVIIKSGSSKWSLCSIDLNEIGSHSIMLPVPKSEATKTLKIIEVEIKFAGPNENGYLLIIFRDSGNKNDDNYEDAALSFLNDTDAPISIRQLNISDAFKHDLSSLVVVVPPWGWVPWGWVDLSSDQLLYVNVDNRQNEDGVVDVLQIEKKIQIKTTAAINLHMKDSSKSNALTSSPIRGAANPYVGSSNCVFIKVIVDNKGHKIIHATQGVDTHPEEDDNFKNIHFHHKPDDTVEYRLSIRSIGLSIIGERPTRREMFSAYISEFSVFMKNYKEGYNEKVYLTSFGMKVMDIQIDNYFSEAPFPILMHTYNASERKKAIADEERQERFRRIEREKEERKVAARRAKAASISEFDETETGTVITGTEVTDEELTEKVDLAFFNLSILREATPKCSSIQSKGGFLYKYIAVRILEVKISIDPATIQLYLLDLHNDLIGETPDQALASESSEKWIKQFNNHTLKHQTTDKVKDIQTYTVKKGQENIAVENLVIHPLKITLSILSTPLPRTKKEERLLSNTYRWLAYVKRIPSLDNAIVRLNSFMVENVYESSGLLMTRISLGFMRDFNDHMGAAAGRVLGSLTAIGKPAVLSRNVGGGVKEFFYEPYQGAIHSPEAFGIGLKKGSKALAKSVGKGFLSSTAAILGSASQNVAKGATFLSGDKEFQRKREETRRATAMSGGVKSHMRVGAESVISGFASGFAGLVTKPYEEGKKSGALGVVKGIGLGVAGLVSKPVAGVTDGIASVAQGVTNQLSEDRNLKHTRPCRAFARSELDINELVLVPISLFTAKAQNFLQKFNKSNNINEVFVDCISLVEQAVQCTDLANVVIVCENIIIYVKNEKVCWYIQYGDIPSFNAVQEFRRNQRSLKIEILVYKGSNFFKKNAINDKTSTAENYTLQLYCDSTKIVLNLYALLLRFKNKIGSPDSMKDLETISQVLTQEEEDQIEEKIEQLYQFGSFNDKKFLNAKIKEDDLLNIVRESFLLYDDGSVKFQGQADESEESRYYRYIDEKICKLIWDWKFNHQGLGFNRCCAVLLLNKAESSMQILKIDVKEGRNITIFGAMGYDSESQTISPGGLALVFGYGFRPSLLDPAHVKLVFHTNFFRGVLSTRTNTTNVEPMGNCRIQFLEKLVLDSFAKYVILLK